LATWAAHEGSGREHRVALSERASAIVKELSAARSSLGDASEKRRAMMEALAQWCEPKAANVIAFAKSSGAAQ